MKGAKIMRIAKEDPQWDGIDVWPLVSGETDEIEKRSIFWNLRDARFARRRLEADH
jgi:hypothetical protein